MSRPRPQGRCKTPRGTGARHMPPPRGSTPCPFVHPLAGRAFCRGPCCPPGHVGGPRRIKTGPPRPTLQQKSRERRLQEQRRAPGRPSAPTTTFSMHPAWGLVVPPSFLLPLQGNVWSRPPALRTSNHTPKTSSPRWGPLWRWLSGSRGPRAGSSLLCSCMCTCCLPTTSKQGLSQARCWDRVGR